MATVTNLPRLRALIVGGGRMGTGWGGFDAYPFTYCHAKLYREHPYIELIGVVEPDAARRAWAVNRWATPAFRTLQEGLEGGPDLISLCTPPDVRYDVLDRLPESVRGVLCEKPYGLTRTDWPFALQIHYPRRFCRFHATVRDVCAGRRPTLFVWARKDLTTVVHFTNLAQWWDAGLVYHDNSAEIPSTNSYRLDAGKWAVEFRNGGLVGGFLERALDNLLDAIEGRAELVSPASEAIRSEAWATKILSSDLVL